MYHLGKPPPHVLDFLEYAKPGDVITHFLGFRENCILDDRRQIYPEVLDAKEKGIIFDVGHGLASFYFENAEAALDQGFVDFNISSDIWGLSKGAHALTFANVLSKFLALGLSL